jgi:hypothetical protein
MKLLSSSSGKFAPRTFQLADGSLITFSFKFAASQNFVWEVNHFLIHHSNSEESLNYFCFWMTKYHYFPLKSGAFSKCYDELD